MSLKLGLLASSQQQAAPLLLDQYPGAAAAYSFRKLRTAYTGPCCQITSSIGDIDIGFVNNYIDINAVINNGSVVAKIKRFYDQSGNGNTMVSPNIGPSIKESNILITINGKIAANKDTQGMFNNNSINLKDGFSHFGAMRVNTSVNDTAGFYKGTNDMSLIFAQPTNEWGLGAYGVAFIARQAAKAPTNYTLFTTYYDGLNGAIKTNGVVRATGTYPNGTIANNVTLHIPTPDSLFVNNYIDFTEHIFYQSTQLANQTGIEANINSYYSIY